MAEGGMIEGLLGEDAEDAAGTEIAAGGGSLDPAAAAAAMKAAETDPTLAAEAAAYFRKQSSLVEEQTRLVRIQTEHLHEQREVTLSRLKWKRSSDRLKAGIHGLLVLVAAAIGGLFAIMLIDAFHSRAIVVEPFVVSPAAFIARGPSGTLIAQQVLDELARLQHTTFTTASQETRDLSNGWATDVKIEVPETGLSIGEIDRFLKARFGHELHIDGDLVQTDGGSLALTVRGNGLISKRFDGPSQDLEKLSVEAAEYVFGYAQPATYTSYLLQHGRAAEAVEFAQSEIGVAEPSERPYLLQAMAAAFISIGRDPREAIALYRSALTLKPDLWRVYTTLTATMTRLGDQRGAWQAQRDMIRAAGGQPGKAPESAWSTYYGLTKDFRAARASHLAQAAELSSVGPRIPSATTLALAADDLELHDLTDATAQLETVHVAADDPVAISLEHMARGGLAAATGDDQQAVLELEAGAAIASTNASMMAMSANAKQCRLALAEEAVGRRDKADAALKAGGPLIDCYRFKGDILAGRGDWAGAQAAYRAAVDIVPDLPAAYYSWGVALAKHGDAAAAIEKLAAANQRGPHWADPLKAWGDVLAGQGKGKAALAKYDEALRYAPAWVALHQARDAVAHRG